MFWQRRGYGADFGHDSGGGVRKVVLTKRSKGSQFCVAEADRRLTGSIHGVVPVQKWTTRAEILFVGKHESQ